MSLRLTFVTTLAVGVLISGPGAALAFDGYSDDNAAEAQYGGGAGGQQVPPTPGGPGQPERPVSPEGQSVPSGLGPFELGPSPPPRRGYLQPGVSQQERLL